MSEEKKPASTSTSGSATPVTRYLTILFAAAFALLLITLAMERRQHDILQEQSQEQIDDLQESISAVQSLQNLYDENDALKEQLNDLELEVNALNDKIIEQAAEKSVQSQTIERQEKALEAMDWFWQIDEAYVRGRYTLCRQLIEQMTELGLPHYLPVETTTNTDRFSPAHRLEEIQEKLG